MMMDTVNIVIYLGVLPVRLEIVMCVKGVVLVSTCRMAGANVHLCRRK